MKFFPKNLHEHTAGQGPGGGHSWQGRVHAHKHNGLHTHDENGIAHDLPDFESMTKKDIEDWANELNMINVDSKNTKANMIDEIKGQLVGKLYGNL